MSDIVAGELDHETSRKNGDHSFLHGLIAHAVSLMTGEEPGWSLDLLRHPGVLQSLDEFQASDAVYLALRHGRMRIPAQYGDYVVRLIGRGRALECSCLPDFKSLAREAVASGFSHPNAVFLRGEGAAK